MKQKKLVDLVEEVLPEFAKAVKTDDASAIILHQDAFAGDYQQSEYYLMGCAIKYAGLYGKEVRIIGRNRDTIELKN